MMNRDSGIVSDYDTGHLPLLPAKAPSITTAARRWKKPGRPSKVTVRTTYY